MAGKNRTGEGRYHAMFENSHQGIILFDKADFTIQESNAAFSSLLHYNPEALRGRVFTSLLSDHEEKRRFLTQVEQSPDIAGFEVRLETKEEMTAGWIFPGTQLMIRHSVAPRSP